MNKATKRLEEVIAERKLCFSCQDKLALPDELRCAKCKKFGDELEAKRLAKQKLLQSKLRRDMGIVSVEPVIDRADYMPDMGWLGYAAGAVVGFIFLGIFGLGCVRVLQIATGFLLQVSR